MSPPDRLGCAVMATLVSVAACPIARATLPDADPEAERIYAIDRQTLPGAILVFSEQAGVQLLVTTDVMAGITANSVRGRMPFAAAIDRLIDGTGLRWRYLGPGVVTIERGPAVAVPTVRALAPIVISADPRSRRLWANGSSDPTATEDTGALSAAAIGVGAKSPAPPLELPRSASVLTADRLAQQGLVSSNDALGNMPGVTAQLVDGVSGYALFSRGLPLTTLSFDGGGPLFYQFVADADARTLIDTPELAEFDHIEVLRGSAGQFGGLAAVSGVINFQRKRPLDHRRLALTVQHGSWNNRRIEADASLPIALDGGLRMRLVGVVQDRDFHYDVSHENRAFLYGTLESEIGGSLSIRLGGNVRQIRRDGFNASGLPRYSDGGDLGWARSTCLCLPTNRAETRLGEQFLVAEWTPGGLWRAAFNATRRTQSTRFKFDQLLVNAERDGSFVSRSVSSAFRSTNHQWSIDLSVSGTILLGPTSIDVTAGTDYADNRARTTGSSQTFDPGIGDPRRTIGTIGSAVRIPDEGTSYEITPGRTAVHQDGQYLTLSARPVDRTIVQLGVRRTAYQIGAAGGPRLRAANGPARFAKFIPSVTLQYELTDSSRIYASYTRSFSAQLRPSSTEVASIYGHAVEIGAKWQVEKAGPLISIAGYAQPTADVASDRPIGTTLPEACCGDVVSKISSYGIDAEVTGAIRSGWEIQAAYNWNRTRYRFDDARVELPSEQPVHQARLWLIHSRPDPGGLWQIGGGVRLNSRTRSVGLCTLRNSLAGVCLNYSLERISGSISQSPYAVGDIRIARRFGPGHEIAINLTNVTDTRYYRTLSGPTSGNYYGEPRAILVTLRTIIE